MSVPGRYERRLQSVFPPGFDSVPSSSKGYSRHYTHSTEQLTSSLINNYDPMVPSETIIVKSTWYGKQTSSPKHEFILIHVEDQREESSDVQPMFNYLILDRNVVGKQAKSRKASKQSQTSIQGAQPIDAFRVSYDGDADRLFEDCNLHPHRLIERLQFSTEHPLYLYELVVLAHLVSGQNPDYRATDSNCYLFAGLIWDSLCEMYPDAIRDRTLSRERGKNGLYRFIVTESQVEATCEKAREEISNARAKIRRRKADLEAYIRNHLATAAQKEAAVLPNRGFTV